VPYALMIDMIEAAPAAAPMPGRLHLDGFRARSRRPRRLDATLDQLGRRVSRDLSTGESPGPDRPAIDRIAAEPVTRSTTSPEQAQARATVHRRRRRALPAPGRQAEIVAHRIDVFLTPPALIDYYTRQHKLENIDGQMSVDDGGPISPSG